MREEYEKGKKELEDQLKELRVKWESNKSSANEKAIKELEAKIKDLKEKIAALDSLMKEEAKKEVKEVSETSDEKLKEQNVSSKKKNSKETKEKEETEAKKKIEEKKETEETEKKEEKDKKDEKDDDKSAHGLDITTVKEVKKDLKEAVDKKKQDGEKSIFGGVVDDFSGIPVIIAEEDMENYLQFLKWKKKQGMKITARAVLKLKGMNGKVPNSTVQMANKL